MNNNNVLQLDRFGVCMVTRVDQKWLKKSTDDSICMADLMFYCHVPSKTQKSDESVCECIYRTCVCLFFFHALYLTSNFHFLMYTVRRCPCDECTITHMITCGIINPDQLETNGAPHTFHFPHDSNRYIIDVTPPSMSSTTSSSSSSPVPISREMAAHHLNSCNLSPR